MGTIAVLLVAGLIFAAQAASAASAIEGDLKKDVVHCDGKEMGTDPKLRCVKAEYARLPGAGATREQMKQSMREEAEQESQRATIGWIVTGVLALGLVGAGALELRRRRAMVTTPPAGNTGP